MNFDLTICDGKYRYEYDKGQQRFFRHGEPWPAMTDEMVGNKFIFCLASEFAEMTKERDALRAELAALKAQEPVAWAIKNGWALDGVERSEKQARLVADERQKSHDLSGSLAAYRVEPLYARPVPAQNVPNIEYSVLRKFADEKRCNFNELCNAVEQAINTGNGCPVPAQSVPLQIGVLHVGSQYGEELEDWEFEADQSACDRLNELYWGKAASIQVYADATHVPDGCWKQAVMEIANEGLGSLFRKLISDRAEMLAAAPKSEVWKGDKG